jgi:hypothetical protein
MSIAKSGAKHPIYGKVAANAMFVFVYTITDNTLVGVYTSITAAGKYFGVSRITIRYYIRSGRVYKGLYTIRNSLL